MRPNYNKDFEKQFRKLPKKIQDRFDERLKIFLENKFHPLLNNHSVEKRFPGCRSINVTGDYRAIFKEVSSDTVIFMLIGTHSEFYWLSPPDKGDFRGLYVKISLPVPY